MLLSAAKTVVREVLNVGAEAVIELENSECLVARVDLCQRIDATLSLRCEVNIGEGTSRVFLTTSLPIWSKAQGELAAIDLEPSFLSALPSHLRSTVTALREMGRNQFSSLLAVAEFGSEFPIGSRQEIIRWKSSELREFLLVVLTAAHFATEYMPSRAQVAQLQRSALPWSGR